MCSIEVVDDLEVDVGFEQGDANLAQGFGDVFFSERALAAKVLEDALQFVGEVFKHGSVPVYRNRRKEIGRCDRLGRSLASSFRGNGGSIAGWLAGYARRKRGWNLPEAQCNN